jgi:glyoxylase-like metal-dependent hydrolase (beta-lactamase superfamily II)
LWIESEGEAALITGDFLHHPVQFAEPDWEEIADADAVLARETRRRMIEQAAQTGALVLGTHFSGRPAGRVIPDGDRWRFLPA